MELRQIISQVSESAAHIQSLSVHLDSPPTIPVFLAGAAKLRILSNILLQHIFLLRRPLLNGEYAFDRGLRRCSDVSVV